MKIGAQQSNRKKMVSLIKEKFLSLWQKKPPMISAFPGDERSMLVSDSIAFIVVLLMAIGTTFVFSASARIDQGIDFQKFYDYPGMRKILFFPLACLIMYTFSCIDFRRYSMENVSETWTKSNY